MLIVLGHLVMTVHLVLVHANGALGLVKHRVASVVVLAAAGLVGKRLASGLGVVGLGRAECNVSLSRRASRITMRTHRAALSPAPVMLSLVLSRVDLEESGVIFSSASVDEVSQANQLCNVEVILTGREVLATGVRHLAGVDWKVGLYGGEVLVMKSV